jgi:ribosomal protein S18 acetylase RimI-like enzyme
MLIRIVPFTNEYMPYFTALNKAWLQKYFEIEPIDSLMLENPKQYFLDKGGFIFFALYNEEVAGTFALQKVDDTIFELSKMAVDDNFKGKAIGNAMMQFCLDEAERLHLKKIILYSNTKLAPAIHLYKKYGFKEIPNFVSEYKRANIKMEIDISQNEKIR